MYTTTKPKSSEDHLKLPHNIEAEQALLGGILLNNKSFFSVANYLVADHFFDPGHQRLFQVSRNEDQHRQSRDAGDNSQLYPDFKVGDIGIEQYLRVLAGQATTILNAGEYGKIIQELSVRRDLIKLSDELRHQAFHTEPDDEPLKQIEEFNASCRF